MKNSDFGILVTQCEKNLSIIPSQPLIIHEDISQPCYFILVT